MVARVEGPVDFNPAVDRFNLFAPGVMDDPYPYYRALRDHAPVHFNEEIGIHYLSRYDDVAALGRDRQRLIRGESSSGVFEEYRGTAFHRVLMHNNLFAVDEPTHGRLKRLIIKTFTRSRVEQLRPRIEEICAQLLDDAGLDPAGGRFELVQTLAYPMPFLVICEFLGISSEDRGAFLGWVRNLLPLTDPFPTPDVVRNGLEAGGAFEGYLTAVLGERRRALRKGAALPPGLISDLVRIAETGDERLSSAELLSLSMTTLLAGFENVTNLISNTMRCLGENPAQAQALREDPSLFANLPDEALRHYSTTQYNLRQAATTLEPHDTRIPEGSMVLLLRGAANRDERRFADPDTFDLRRPDSAAHVGFGEGPTSCTGAMLARVEVQVAFRELVRRLGEFRIARLDPGPTKLFWGPRAIEVEYQPTRSAS
jgi:cytochrome P450